MGLRWNADWSHLLRKQQKTKTSEIKFFLAIQTSPLIPIGDLMISLSPFLLLFPRVWDAMMKNWLAIDWIWLRESPRQECNFSWAGISQTFFFLLADGDVEMLGWKFKSQVLLESEKSFKTPLNKIIFYCLIFRSELLFNFWRYKLFCLLFLFAHPWMRLHHVLFLALSASLLENNSPTRTREHNFDVEIYEVKFKML